jgi:membrane-associated phospholipid phosphatase
MVGSCFVALVLAFALASCTAHAQERTRDFGENGYMRVHPAEALVTLAVLTTAFYLRYDWQIGEARWRGDWSLDDGARSAFALSSESDRSAAATITDIVLNSMFLYLVVDPVVTAWLAGGDEDAMWQIGLIDTETLAIIFFLSTLLQGVTARERPFVDRCAADPGYASGCTDDDPTSLHVSFPSGHSAMAFGVAGLTCAHHAHLSLYGDAGWDTGACIGSIVLASATSVMRLPTDTHWLTDVLAGAALGFAIGYLFPTLVHYQHRSDAPAESSPSVAVMPIVGADQYGLSLIGPL